MDISHLRVSKYSTCQILSCHGVELAQQIIYPCDYIMEMRFLEGHSIFLKKIS